MPFDLNKTPHFIFIREAAHNFSSPIRAVKALGNLGSPPIGSTKPSSKMESALGVFAYLTWTTSFGVDFMTRKGAATCVQKHWLSISPWMEFFLDYISCTTQEDPQSDQFVDDLLITTPIFLQYFGALEDPHAELRRLRTESPYLKTYVIEVWLRVIDNSHPSWFSWTETLSNLFPKYVGERLADDFPRAVTFCRRRHDFEIPYIRHLQRLSQNPQEIPDDELQGYNLSTGLLFQYLCCEFTDHTPFLRAGGSQALSKALTTLLSRPRTFKGVAPGSERFRIAIGLVEHLLSLALLSMGIATYVCEALDTGLLVAFFRAKRFYGIERSRGDKRPVWDEDSPTHFHDLFVRLLAQLATYTIFPSVLHRFLKAIARIEELGLEADIPNDPKMKSFWSTWGRCKDRAKIMSLIYGDIKNDAPGNLCGYQMCYLKGARGLKLPDGHRYLRCGSCLSKVYCSRKCAHNDWKEHRFRCEQLTVARRSYGKYLPSNADFAFFRGVKENHVWENRTSIMEAMMAHEATVPRNDPLKSGMLVVHFDNPEFLNPLSSACHKFTNFHTLDKTDMTPALLQDIKKCLIQAAQSSLKICVLGYFPNGLRETLTVVNVVDIEALVPSNEVLINRMRQSGLRDEEISKELGVEVK
ncbi:hypothetical protein VNI00_009916 [Paramarasmius palmivorus]|uniref:MYND-type domain-containing protein n=1 Tax=Paramarasmius palmivorus TaxID=297713 RepID=A0AAW0CMI2_9AGAR